MNIYYIIENHAFMITFGVKCPHLPNRKIAQMRFFKDFLWRTRHDQ